jgi:RNA polymerase sigma-70 factor, ECF subfamily
VIDRVTPAGDIVARVPPGLDDASRAWVAGLQASGVAHDRCLEDLHALLLRVARHEAMRRASSIHIGGPELDDIVHQAGDDALMAIKSKVGDFRGESRFTTWAYRFVVFEVSTKIGRHFWQRRPVALDSGAWEQMPDVLTPSPEHQAEQRELLETLRAAIDDELTELQRRVFVAVALNQVPMDAFARELGATRNAVYKTLFDARRKLRACLAAAGHPRPATPIRAS